MLCPICKREKGPMHKLVRHMNQSNGSCHEGMDLYHEFQRAARRTYQWDREQGHVDEDYDDAGMDLEEGNTPDFNPPEDDDNAPDFGPPEHPEYPPAPATGPIKDYFAGAAKVQDRGDTFLETFRKDKYSEHRASSNNIYYPWASAAEWELVAFLHNSKMTMAQIDRFLKLQLVSGMHLSFHSAKEMQDRIASLPRRPEWQVKLWPTEFPTEKPVYLFWRDPLECLQELFSNPLVQGHIHFTPFKLWESSARLTRSYTEWLSGTAAWDMQASIISPRPSDDPNVQFQAEIPPGHALGAAILTSDETHLTNMTGNKHAHPVLLSTALIDAWFRMKASFHAFLLLMLIPIVKFCETNAEVKGVLKSRMFHAMMDFVLEPLKIVAKVGKMMADPVGNLRIFHTVIAAYIVDTPEACMIAIVASKSSPVTTATNKQLGDDFRHPVRTRAHTMEKLHEIEGPKPEGLGLDPWNDLLAYIKAAKDCGLNGVHRPFWQDWFLAEPSVFLTPEILHHWCRFSWDHIVKWAMNAVGKAEIDFRFALLRWHTGMRKFAGGISKAKQVTGKEQRDILRYLLVVIAGAVPTGFSTAIQSLITFFYRGQAPAINEIMLTRMDASLKAFHDNKKHITHAGARQGAKGNAIETWHGIPKLEFLQSVVPAIRATGVPLHWSADVTEHAHIELVKEPARHSNNHGYESQIVRHLDRRDKVRFFQLATAMHSARVDMGDPGRLPLAYDDVDANANAVYNAQKFLNSSSDLVEQIGPVAGPRDITNYFAHSLALLQQPNALQPFRCFTSADGRTAFCLNRDPTPGRRLSVDEVVTLFALPDLPAALQAFIYRAQPDDGPMMIGGRRPNAAATVRLGFKLQVWDGVALQSKAYHDPKKILDPETVNCSPPNQEWPYGRGDPVLVNTDPHYRWPESKLQGHNVCELKLIFRAVPERNFVPPTGKDQFLAYVQRFNVAPEPDPSTRLYKASRTIRDDKTIVGDVIPLERLRAAVDLNPIFGKTANRKLTVQNTFHYCTNFWLNPFFTKEFFWALDE
ncbi:hypothetical protein DFH06DRAFT_1124357 [Mycena polygramma]|nr:hypothetical protein DFH06DRAFT_1124357 [Mycena polygramma]